MEALIKQANDIMLMESLLELRERGWMAGEDDRERDRSLDRAEREWKKRRRQQYPR